MNEALTRHRPELDALCRRFHVRRLDLFGSAARGQARDDSDLDFLVEFEPLPEGGYADVYFGLLDALQTLFRRPVDLVVASAIRNPYFRQSIESSRTSLYAA
jgi:predicted nucleotidyltransferase